MKNLEDLGVEAPMCVVLQYDKATEDFTKHTHIDLFGYQYNIVSTTRLKEEYDNSALKPKYFIEVVLEWGY